MSYPQGIIENAHYWEARTTGREHVQLAVGEVYEKQQRKAHILVTGFAFVFIKEHGMLKQVLLVFPLWVRGRVRKSPIFYALEASPSLRLTCP